MIIFVRIVFVSGLTLYHHNYGYYLAAVIDTTTNTRRC